jgi:hypothetical protein
LATDTQGYQVVSSPSSTERTIKSSSLRNARELTAISWAAYCSDVVPTLESITYRIQAIDTSNLFERLTIAFQMLRKKKVAIQQQLQQAGLQYKRDDDDNNNNNNSKDQDSSK